VGLNVQTLLRPYRLAGRSYSGSTPNQGARQSGIPLKRHRATAHVSPSVHVVRSSTKEQLAAIEKAIKTNQEGVIKKIVERVIRSDPQMHQNLKKVEA